MTAGGTEQAGGSEFIAEAEELLEALGEELQAVDDERQAGRVRPQRVNALFRLVHSIKGLAGLFGQSQLSHLTHSLEDYLDALRMGRVPFNGSSLDLLFAAHEQLETMVAGGGASEYAPSDLLQRLQSQKPLGSERVTTARSVPEELLSTLTSYEEHRLKESLREGAHLWMIALSLDMDTFDDELRSLVNVLNQDGEVISTLPRYEADAGQGRLSFRLLYSGLASYDGLMSLLPRGSRLTPLPDVDGDAVLEPEAQIEIPEDDDIIETLDRASVRVGLDRLDRILDVVGELLIFRRHIEDVSRQLKDHDSTREVGSKLHRASADLDKKLQDLQRSVIGARMVPMGRIVGRLSRLVRKLARSCGKEVMLEMEGAGTELDKMLIDRLQSPLIHLVRNAVYHGIETPEKRKASGKHRVGRVLLRAAQRGNEVILTLHDDGHGLDIENLRAAALRAGLVEPEASFEMQDACAMIFSPGFSSVAEAGEVSGRGFGLDVVQRDLKALGGKVRLDSVPGQGTSIDICLPITLAIMPCMVVRAGAMEFALPVAGIAETLRYSSQRMETISSRPVVRLRGKVLAYGDLRHMMCPSFDGSQDPAFIVVARAGESPVALGVDELIGHHEVVIKPAGGMLEGLPGIAGATELGGGRAALVLDMGSLELPAFNLDAA